MCGDGAGSDGDGSGVGVVLTLISPGRDWPPRYSELRRGTAVPASSEQVEQS